MNEIDVSKELIGNVNNVLPEAVILKYGTCERCNWRGTDKCNNKVVDGSCANRKEFLQFIGRTSGFDYKIFQNAYDMYVSSDINDRDLERYLDSDRRLGIVRDKLDNLEKYGGKADEAEIKAMKREYDKLKKDTFNHRQNWETLWGKRMLYVGKEIDRMTPKKVEVTQKHELTIDQINSIIRDKREKVIEVNVVNDGNGTSSDTSTSDSQKT